MLASLICPAPLREDDANDDTFRLNLFPDNSLFFGADDSDDSAAGVPKLSRSVNINGKADRKSVSTRMAELGFDDDCEMRDAVRRKNLMTITTICLISWTKLKESFNLISFA